jgi:hypothetical protein
MYKKRSEYWLYKKWDRINRFFDKDIQWEGIGFKELWDINTIKNNNTTIIDNKNKINHKGSKWNKLDLSNEIKHL